MSQPLHEMLQPSLFSLDIPKNLIAYKESVNTLNNLNIESQQSVNALEMSFAQLNNRQKLNILSNQQAASSFMQLTNEQRANMLGIQKLDVAEQEQISTKIQYIAQTKSLANATREQTAAMKQNEQAVLAQLNTANQKGVKKAGFGMGASIATSLMSGFITYMASSDAETVGDVIESSWSGIITGALGGAVSGAMVGMAGGPMGAGVGALVGALIGIIGPALGAVAGVIDVLNPSFEEQAEKLQQLSAEYDQFASSLSSARDRLKEMNQQIKELEAKKQSMGFLTLTEQEDLDRLIKENEQVQHQAELLEQQAEAAKKAQEAAASKAADKFIEDNLGDDGTYESALRKYNDLVAEQDRLYERLNEQKAKNKDLTDDELKRISELEDLIVEARAPLDDLAATIQQDILDQGLGEGKTKDQLTAVIDEVLALDEVLEKSKLEKLNELLDQDQFKGARETLESLGKVGGVILFGSNCNSWTWKYCG